MNSLSKNVCAATKPFSGIRAVISALSFSLLYFCIPHVELYVASTVLVDLLMASVPIQFADISQGPAVCQALHLAWWGE